MYAAENVKSAKLDLTETKRFKEISSALSENILSKKSVAVERQKAKASRDTQERRSGNRGKEEQINDVQNPANDIYRVFKNNEILSQIIKNQCGSLKKDRIREIIEIISESGLRLVNIFLKNEEEIIELACYIQKKNPTYDIKRIKHRVQFFSFLWTIINIEKIVSAINYPEIKNIVNDLTRQQSTPAYDLIGYFSKLDSADELTETIKKDLESLLKKHNDPFLQKLLVMRTKHYMNTHTSKAKIEQSVHSLLEIKYQAMLVRS